MFDLACDSDPNGVQLHKVPMQSLNDKDIFPSCSLALGEVLVLQVFSSYAESAKCTYFSKASWAFLANVCKNTSRTFKER